MSCGAHAGVGPDDADHRDVDLRKDVDRHAQRRADAQQARPESATMRPCRGCSQHVAHQSTWATSPCVRRGIICQRLAHAKQLPRPACSSTSTSAPWAAQIDFTIDSPRPAPPCVARARAVDAEEALEDVRQRLRRDADAVIGDLEYRVGPSRRTSQAHAPAARGVLDGVVEQVDDHLLEARAVARTRRGAAALALHRDAACPRPAGSSARRWSRRARRGRTVAHASWLLAGIQPRQRQQALDDFAQALDFLQHAAEPSRASRACSA